MTETIHSPTTARRGLLAGAAALAVTAAPAGAGAARLPDPDATLHEAAAKVRAADDAIALHLLDDPPDEAADEILRAHEDLTSRLTDRWSDAVVALADTEPKTVAGMVAKAQATIIAFDRNVPTLIGDTVEDVAEDHIWLAYQTAHNVLSLAGVEPWPAHPAKAEFVRRHEARMRARGDAA